MTIIRKKIPFYFWGFWGNIFDSGNDVGELCVCVCVCVCVSMCVRVYMHILEAFLFNNDLYWLFSSQPLGGISAARN